ncbi:MAG TPA: RagB/SusD family nutrient uptake outer membrane protein [Flavisolibacter sp.]|nr:RagB/SusD family nutrient uptake outer membrane protein [Flavisolibacter sp.]
MKQLKKICQYTAVVLLLLTLNACTKLEENVYSSLITDNFYNNKQEVLAAVLRPYTHANAWITPGQNGWWRLSELSADQLAWPVKGRHGQDGGQWIRMHYHTWQAGSDEIWSPWRLMWWGLGLCSDPVDNLEKRDIGSMGITQQEKDAYVSELKMLRVFHYLRLMDLYGNIPIIKQIGEESPATQSRAAVFAFIEKEIKDNIDKLPNLSAAMVGRMSKAGAYGMLVELYLNAQAWTGTPRWDDCIAACNALINNQAGGQNGAMALDPNITDTYKPTNHLSKEFIFSIAYEFQNGVGWKPQWTGDFYHFNQRYIYDGTHNGNDGVVMIPGVYSKFKNNDLRKREWILAGPQFYLTNPTQIVPGSEEYAGKQLVFVDSIQRVSENKTQSDMTQGEENSGLRFNKYKPGRQADATYMSTDWAIYRLTWVYFAKAEALMRKNNGIANAEAVQLVNDCKKRAFSTADWTTEAYTPATLTLDELLDERGREFIFEGFRRQDLIRFGKYTTASWWDHAPSGDKNKEIYPVPSRQLILNPNLVQNQGY